MVRARNRKHLEALQERFRVLIGGCEIQDNVGTDYPFRFFAEKAVWSQVVAGLSEELDYDNFKSEVARSLGKDGADYETALHKIWGVMARLQK